MVVIISISCSFRIFAPTCLFLQIYSSETRWTIHTIKIILLFIICLDSRVWPMVLVRFIGRYPSFIIISHSAYKKWFPLFRNRGLDFTSHI